MSHHRSVNNQAGHRKTKISILITCYNYEAYIAESINSALSVDWAEKEIIVVDDDSTDRSWKVIQSFGLKILAIRQTNSGPNVILNRVIDLISGDILITLDADDVLLPQVAKLVSEAWTVQTVKVQWPVILSDQKLIERGLIWPKYPKGYSPASVVRSLDRFGTYAYSMTSGCAWSVAWLRGICPIPFFEEGLRNDLDGVLGKLSPRFGDVVTLSTPLTIYRMHGKNNSLPGLSLNHIAYTLEREEKRVRLINRVLRANSLKEIFEEISEESCMFRLIGKRFISDCKPKISLNRALLEYLIASSRSGVSIRKKIIRAIWAVTITYLPQRVAVRIALSRWRSH